MIKFMENLEIILKNEDSTIKAGEITGKYLTKPSVIYLEGDLGAGKTCFSKGIAKGLEINEEITSPTFTLINEYNTSAVNLFHLDLYRLDNLKQIFNLGIEDFINEEKSITIFEWSEKLDGYKFSESYLEIKILHWDGKRKIIIKSSDSKYETLMKELKNFADSGN